MRDETGLDTDKLWNDVDAGLLFDDACDELCRETRYFTGAMVDAVCLIPLVAGTRHYQLHKAVVSVERVRPSWRSQQLEKSCTADLDAGYPSWLTATGRPTAWVVDYEPGYLTMSAAPTATGDSLRLTVVRRQIDNSASNLEIPEQWHKHLKHYMSYQALFKQDSEVKGASSQSDFKATWDDAVEKMKQDILKMGRSTVGLSLS